jgi:hypothetical protein
VHRLLAYSLACVRGGIQSASGWREWICLIFISFNTFIAKVDHGRFKYLCFKLPASTLVDLKFTLFFCLK